MNQQIPTVKSDPVKKERFNALRKERKPQIAAITGRVRTHNKAMDAIQAQIQTEGKTVPQIAEATGIPSQEVLWYVATLKKYGKIIEAEKAESYYRYRSAEGKDDARQS